VKKKTLFTTLVVLTGMLFLSASMLWATDAPVPRTGQTLCYDAADNGSKISCEGTGQDGEYQMGVAWPDPRFTDNGDGTVTDHLTGLMWAQDAARRQMSLNWFQALSYANTTSFGTSCGGPYTDWRLPNAKEALSLSDYGSTTGLPSGHPFLNAPMTNWTSTTYSRDTTAACYVGQLFSNKYNNYWPWLLRGGN